MKYSLFLELPPVCTEHQLIVIGKMELRLKTKKNYICYLELLGLYSVSIDYDW